MKSPSTVRCRAARWLFSGNLFLGGLFLLSGARARSDLLPATEPKATETIDLGGGVAIEFVLIRPGSFLMGSENNEYDEKPVHQVTLTQSYYLGKYEVTQEQWTAVMGENPSVFKGEKRPVENVSWDDCQLFLDRLRKKLGRHFSLPTEAQWEYACRAGTTSSFSNGEDDTALGECAWYASNAELRTHPVGQKKANRWGLYDMHGNVYEWCADWYSETYAGGDAIDPLGPANGDRRTIRGGAWLYVADNLRSAERGFSPSDYRINEYGLRCVMEAGGGSLPRTDPITAPIQVHAVPGPNESGIMAPVERVDTVVAQLEAALAAATKLQAEGLLARLEFLAPHDARVSLFRGQVAALPEPERTLVVELGDGVTMELQLIHPGSFILGSNESVTTDEKPASRVTITRPYYLGKFEVTQRQWEKLMSRNLSVFKGAPSASDAGQRPVDNVSWFLCQSFLSKLNERAPGHHFRLPTEAEWEYACRAGTAGEYSFPESDGLDRYAWYGSNSGGETHPVGSKAPNPWGLYDLYGNVWEWCQDEYGPYSALPVADPAGPRISPSGARVARGGSWSNTPDHVNSTFRHDVGPDVMMRYYGFRCAAEVGPR